MNVVVQAIQQPLHLLGSEGRTHERNGRDTGFVEPENAEVAFNDDEMLGIEQTIEVEEDAVLLKARRELVLVLPFGPVVAGPAAGVGDELAFLVADRDRNPTRHAALATEAEAKGLDNRFRDALRQVRMRRIELEGKA